MQSVDDSTDGIIRLKEKYEVCLPLFEGPLDLLLHLIRKQEIDIYDIPIATITEQYLEYVRVIQHLNINVAGEFLEMAATLIYIKSRMLLPPDPVSEEDVALEVDPRQELVERLLEYERYKNAAQNLYTMHQVESGMWNVSRMAEVVSDDDELVAVSVIDLVAAFQNLMKRFEDRITMEMERERISVAETMEQIRELLKTRQTLKFSSFLQQRISRLKAVVLFMAILELVKSRAIGVRQEDLFEDIIIIRKKKMA